MRLRQSPRERMNAVGNIGSWPDRRRGDQNFCHKSTYTKNHQLGMKTEKPSDIYIYKKKDLRTKDTDF